MFYNKSNQSFDMVLRSLTLCYVSIDVVLKKTIIELLSVAHYMIRPC